MSESSKREEYLKHFLYCSKYKLILTDSPVHTQNNDQCHADWCYTLFLHIPKRSNALVPQGNIFSKLQQ